MEPSYDEAEGACRCERSSERPSEGCPDRMVQMDDDTIGGEMVHVNIRDDIEPARESKDMSTIDQGATRDANIHQDEDEGASRFPDHQSQQTNMAKVIRDEHVETAHGEVEAERI